MAKTWIAIAGGSGFFAVALGAFGAHLLKGELSPQMMAVYHTANQYHFYNTLALMMIGVMQLSIPQSMVLQRAAQCMLLGLIFFCGSLYLLAISHITLLGIITPIGGVFLLIGWLLVCYGMYQKVGKNN